VTAAPDEAAEGSAEGTADGTWAAGVAAGGGSEAAGARGAGAADAEATADQVLALAGAGSELVRITVNTLEAARAVPAIHERLLARGCGVPLVGDFHYNGHLLLRKFPKAAELLAKYRINPGNVGTRHRDDNFRTIVEVAVEFDKPVRIGVNWGSLDQNLLTQLMDANAAREEPLEAKEVYFEAMLESALRSAALAEEVGLAHDKILISANAGPSQMAGQLCDKNYFSTSWQNDQTPMAMGEVLNKNVVKSLYIIAPNYAAGKDMVAGLERTFKGEVKGKDLTKWGADAQLDFSAELAKAKASGAEGIFVF